MSTSPPLWSGLTPEEHEFQYNPQAAFPDFKDAQANRAAANKAALDRLAREADIAFGDHPLRKLDVYPVPGGGSPKPVHVFLHGGYWRAQDKQNFAFVAEPLVAEGIVTVVTNYELCPASTLDGVAESVLAAIAWIRDNIAAYGGDPLRVTLSGHSAGAHLAAEVLAHEWGDPSFLRGVVAISGIFDPRPVMGTSVNAEVCLTEEIARRRDVERRPVLARCPVSIFVGGREPWQWIDQSYRYGHHLHSSGLNPEVHVLPRWGHFDILSEYQQRGSAILAAILSQAKA